MKVLTFVNIFWAVVAGIVMVIIVNEPKDPQVIEYKAALVKMQTKVASAH